MHAWGLTALATQVGPPPGIAAGTSLEVQSHIPVVFFTATGLPGEVGQDVEGVADVLPGQLQQQHGTLRCIAGQHIPSSLPGAGRGCLVESFLLKAFVAERALQAS